MPDLLNLKTPHFELSVWAKDVEASQALLDKTHTNRNIEVPCSSIRFNPALKVLDVTPPTEGAITKQYLSELTLPELLFFENKQYEFEFLFFNGVNTTTHSPAIIHRLRNVEEGFHYKRGFLRGSVNFGNDIGWFRLGLR